MISVVKGIFFRSTDFNFQKIEFSGPTKQPHFRKSISGSDFHPKQTQPLYERDNETLGPTTYYVVDTERWAVSNVGYFSGPNNA